jgi:beta-lactamase regulating signal transducer with metallopeptidase domain
MNFLTDFCLPALILSLAAFVSLRFMGETSVRFRTSLAVIGLLAWFAPWSRLTLSAFALPNLPLPQWIDSTPSVFEDGAGPAPGPATETPRAMQIGSWCFLLFAPGALLFMVDLLRRSRRVQRLEREAQDGEYLRSLLPRSLESIPGRIRIIPGSNAMATGMLRRTIWVGEGLRAHSEVKTALVHECCHLRRRDPALILAVNLVRRLYCWNPIVALLCRQLLLLFEQACDANSARVLGRSEYQRSLARLLLETHADDMTLAPGVLGSRSGYRRIRAIESGSASILRRLNVTVMILAAGLLAVSVNAQQRDPRIGEWRENYYPPNSVGLLPPARALLGNIVSDQTGLTGRYTMELDYPFPPQRPVDSAAPAELGPPSLFTAVQEQRGLRFVPGKGPFRLVVVENAQLPTPN